MALGAGNRLGPYEIVSAIGAGGMGEVYRARDPRLDRQVAIKVLPAETAADPQARERLRREALAAAALDHPYICKIFEIGEDDGVVFLAMEYVAGRTLHQRLREGRLPLAETLRLAGEIAEALEEAHARGFLHRDLKPANVMLASQGHVKVMDFGLAKKLEPSSSPDDATRELAASPLTTQGAVVGTPDYMSPEQMKGQPLDARSDLFSFGVMLAEMAGGRHPFRRPSAIETCTAVLGEPPEIGADVPSGVRRVLERLLAKNPADRYASATDVRADLARLASPLATDAGASAAGPGQSPWRRIAWVAVAAAAVIVALLLLVRSAGVWPSSGTPGAATMDTIRSIAVLPLDNYSGDPNQDYFAEGMTDELTTQLATISQLRVISRGSTMQFKGDKRPPAPEIGKALDVDALVEGSVVREGDRVRITAQLIDARADRHLWAKSFERSSRDVLALQDDLAAAIANEIHVQLTPTEQSRLASAPTVNPDAHDAYLKGRYFFNRPSDENLKKAITQFDTATKLSPTFAPAFSGLSDAYLWAGYNEGFLTASEARPKAKAAAERAVALDDSSAEAHTSLAVFKLFYEYDWAGCEREFRRAIALNPNYAFAHDQFSLALAFQGRLDEAFAEGKRAAELDPLSPQIPIDQAIAYLFRDDAATAKALAARAADLDSTFFFPDMVIGWADLEDRKFREAIPALKKAQAMDAPPFVTAYLAYAYGASRDRAGAMAELERLTQLSSGGRVLPFNLAMVYLGLGDRARAIDYLEQAHAADSQMLGWLKEDHIFDSLRAEPRFKALLQTLGFQP
jgi:eukaryotic-like serine/threonine-protein kinase